MLLLQEKEGMRFIGVTGVQRCALPISGPVAPADLRDAPAPGAAAGRGGRRLRAGGEPAWVGDGAGAGGEEDRKSVVQGKSVELGGRRIIKKKKHRTNRTHYHLRQTSYP